MKNITILLCLLFASSSNLFAQPSESGSRALRYGEDPRVPHYLPAGVTASCVSGTVNRFSGSYHGNLYIGNSSGANMLLAWGQGMAAYMGSGSGDLLTPTVISAANYGNGTLYEVRSSSSGGQNGYSAFALRTSTKLYFWGTSANLTAITAMNGFGAAALTTAASDVTAKLPAGVSIGDVAQMAISQTAFAIVTTAGHVYVLTTVLNLQGDKAAAGTAVWHHVALSDTTMKLSGVTKFSLSSSGAFALTDLGKIYYWGSPANVAGTANTSTSYNYAYDMSAQIPAGVTVSDLVVLGTTTPSSSTLFILGTNQKVYGCGLNTNGVLGINSNSYGTNQATFAPVKGTNGTTDLTDIVRIDGDTEADIFCMAAMSSTGKIYGWGDGPAGMLGLPATGASTSSYPLPKTVQLYDTTMVFGDFSVAGHFTIAFYNNGVTDQYWYLGHDTHGSIGDGKNNGSFVVEPGTSLNSISGVSFNCSNTQPTVTVSAALSAFASCAGSASATQSFTVSGTGLSSSITVTAPAGFEVSTSAGSGFGSNATLTQSGGNVNSRMVYVRLALNPSATSGTITCSSSSAADQTVSLTGSVNPLPTVASTTPGSRSGTGTVSLSGTASAGATLDWYDAASGGSAMTGGTAALSFTTPGISATTTYFAEARSTSTGCTSGARTAVTATVTGSFAGGSIGVNQTICANNSASGLTSISAASGGNGTISYQWQMSTTSASAGFAGISGATSTALSSQGALGNNTWYRRSAVTTVPGDGTAYSNVVAVTVNVPPAVTATVPNSRSGAGSVILQGTPSQGATIDWYDDAAGGTVLTGGNGVTTFSTPSINSTATFYAEARHMTTGCVAGARTAVVATISAPLPVQLTSFTGALKNGGLELTWRTESEVNNYGFEIQQSPSGVTRQWTGIGFAAGHGTTTAAHEYRFAGSGPLQEGYYRLKQIDLDASAHYSEEIRVDASTTGVLDELPGGFGLRQNYPNPFNPSTVIRYSIPARAFVKLSVYDVLGREVVQLVNGEQETGNREIMFDGAGLASGIYFARLQNGEKTAVQKMILQK